MKNNFTFTSLKEANTLAIKADKKSYILLTLLNILSVLNTFVSLEYTQKATDTAYALYKRTCTFRNGSITIICFAVSLLFFKILDTLKKITTEKLFLNMNYEFNNTLNTKLSSIKWDYYESHETYLKIHEVKTKTFETLKTYINSIMLYISSALLAVVYGYFLLQINFLVVIFYIILLVAINKITTKMFLKIQYIWDEIQPYNQKENYFFNLSGDKTTHQEYKFNRLFGFVRDKWNGYYDEEYTLRMKIYKRYELLLQLGRFILNVPYISMMIYVIYEIAQGKHTLGFFLLCNTLFNGIMDSFGSVQQTLADDRIQNKFVKSYYYILGLEDSENDTLKIPIEYISFKDVHYSYPQAVRESLKGVNLTLNKGEKIAIVGHNGSGKTTFTNILTGLTKDYTGAVKINGLLYNDTSKILKNNVSCIFQNFAQYQMTIKENIESGCPGRDFSDKEILDILDKVGLKEKILSLPQGINTNMGQLDDGVELSKGQWQRLAISRLLADKEADIWVLDEPTAYLDPISEINIYDMIYKLAEDKTVLFISHRLGFAKKADKIIVFNDGKITETGSHEELMQKDGIYAKMYKTQKEFVA
ncbi:ABC transporter ATP-binding protein [Inconstantimicrobium porci]|uniref:ABC transporter ATP-binding protein n=1 Tax=Inconstantimicrobium porci TaxID=2652291 RepID=UPI00240949FE|nr:ABC transporter ATP-binding protein [Inconstantimicrobium porci]MDD6769494.1 ABC transporter ATP-binding protein [Inconstantimicrobium porci]